MISVIVPIYNAEPYIKYCIDSILMQTYQDFELLLVDDGSTDNSAKICNDYCIRDMRCKLIRHQQNKGLSPARNTGLRTSIGDYITFIDADDWIHPKYFEYLLRAINSSGCSLSLSLVEIGWHEKKVPIVDQIIQYSTRIVSQEDLIKGLFCITTQEKMNMEGVMCNTAWGKLYRRELLNDMFFTDMLYEDTEYNFRVYQRLKCAVVVQEKLYYWLRHGDSLSFIPVPSKIDTFFDETLLALKEIPVSMQKDRGAKLLWLYKNILSIRYRVLREEKYYPYLPTFYPKINKIAKEYWREFVKNKHIKIQHKTIILFFYYIPFSYVVFRWIMNYRVDCK